MTCARKSFRSYFPKVILKLHRDGKLQVTLVYYLYCKRHFSYWQTLWLVKFQIIYVDFENSYMLWTNHYLIFPLRGNWVPLKLTTCGYSKNMKVICSFDELANFALVEMLL